MSYIKLYPSDREQPDEFESDNPVECAVCGQIWDLDEDDDGKFVEVDEEYYCAGACAASVTEVEADNDNEPE